ncbi:MAG: valine--tRNA ligase [Candidatus Theseobacter exili]|nr:valine--tRNA ligase [Candidatus Theseobacter exili]
MKEIPKQYNPKLVEDRWFSTWSKENLFRSDRENSGQSYTIVIPPPNVTGILHMGHALNNTLQDILIRWRRLQGQNSLWLPGTDHAGIATQNVVERKLFKKKVSKEQLGREKFLEEVWDWKEEHGNTIISQLKKLGCSCDWSRERFTMDTGLSRAVREAFVRLYEKGLIYRGDYIINWCPRCKTALSDEEAEHRTVQGALYNIKYPIDGTKWSIEVATTRPETMLGDLAVAVNPKDKRYSDLVGKTLILPILNRRIQVVADDFVDPDFGTGAVKVTPAHDPNDFHLGLRHGLVSINVMNEDGTMNSNAGDYEGMDRFECREALLVDLKERGLLGKVVPHEHAVGHCYRCHTIVEPRLSRQWFVRMQPLAEPAIKAVKSGKLTFHPGRWSKVYLEWMENIRDWCISRQIWWGHRIPVFTCDECGHVMVTREDPSKCDECSSSAIKQDPDVLDTWFSSWLWPFSTFNWPDDDPDLKFFYPTDVLITAQEIIFFWVARMIMAGIEFTGKLPFKKVYIHGTVRDDTGTKMSKSLGNVIDPLDIIKEVGADALRFSLIMITAKGQDVFLSRDKFDIGRNFSNKLWNASRFLLMNLQQVNTSVIFDLRKDMNLDDRYILGKLNQTIHIVNSALEDFSFNEAVHAIYDFFWHHFCDRYIEVAKSYLYDGDQKEKEKTGIVLAYVLDSVLHLLHPFMPYITEEIWQLLKDRYKNIDSKSDFLMKSNWPEYEPMFEDPQSVILAEKKFEIIRVARNIRTEYNVSPAKIVRFAIKTVSAEETKFVKEHISGMQKLLKASEIIVDEKFKTKEPLPSGICESGTVFMFLDEAIDVSQELERLQKRLDKIDKELEIVKKKLSNQSFLKNAPESVIKKERSKNEALLKDKERLEKSLFFLEGLSRN